MTIKTLQVGPLSIRASLKPDTVNEEKRTVDVTFSMGAKVLRSNWMDGQFLEELVMTPEACRLERLNNGAPFLNTHDGGDALRVYGVVEPGSAKIANGAGVCTVRFDTAENDPDADKLFRKIKAGIVANVSVGYRSHTIEKIVKEGEKIPTYRVTSWTPFEVSAVPMGADDGAGFRSADQQTNEVQITHTEEQNVKMRKLMQNDDGNGGGGAPPAPPAPPVNLDAVRAEAMKAERERTAGIMHACRTAKLGDEFATKLINDGTALDAARALVIDELAKRDVQDAPTSHARVTGVEGGDERDKLVRGISAAVFHNSGEYGAKVAEAQRRNIPGFSKAEVDLDGGQFRGMRLSDISRMFAERGGKSTRGVYDRQELFNLAKRASTGDFAVLFENVMYKLMRASYAVQQATWRRWIKTMTNKDYRASNHFMRGAFANTLPVVPENGEYKQIGIPDGSKVSVTTETRGGTIGISRQAIINDDMGALASLAGDFGALAGDTLEDAAYDLLLENSGLGPTLTTGVFFDNAAHNNVNTSSVLGVAGLDSDREKFGTHPRGNSFIDQTPEILLIPRGLYGAAEILNKSMTDHTTALDGKPNVVQGMFRDIIPTSKLTGTRRYMFNDRKDAFVCVFLEGAGEGPTMSSEESFLTDGLTWKARIDFKFNPFDPKSALTSAGTA